MQDSKQLILAIVLCLIVLFGWGYFAEYMGWVQRPDPQLVAQQQEEFRKQAAEAERRREEAAKVATLPVFKPSPGQEISIDSPLYTATLYTGGGTLRSFDLKKYRVDLTPNSPAIRIVEERTAAVAPLGLVLNSQPSWSTGQWSLEGEANNLHLLQGEQQAIRLVGLVDNLHIVRELTFSGDSYLIQEKTRVTNTSENTRSLRLGYTVAMDAANSADNRYDVMRVAWDNDGKLDEESSLEKLQSSGVQNIGKIYWAGAMSTYFLAAILPDTPNSLTIKGVARNTVFRTALEESELLLEPGQEREFTVKYWLGPKDRKQLDAVSTELAKSVDLGMFSLIAKGLLWLLQFFYDYVQNWGVAILLLTFVIKALFWPLTAKSYASMEKMKKLKPFMDSIREKYKDDKEKMNKEVMSLYKTYGVNPASGCVPMLIQLPVFFGLYQALLTSLELRHAHFISHLPFTDYVWLADLSAKDPFYITPLVMGLTMFLQQKMSPPASDPTQQKIMMFLPLIFTFLFLGFPSGLVIYWLMNNILSILQQWLMMRKFRTSSGNAK